MTRWFNTCRSSEGAMRQDTHLDSLADRLRHPSVQAVIEPIVAGKTLENVPPEDIQFVLDIGLCRCDDSSGLVIANPIYQEIMVIRA